MTETDDPEMKPYTAGDVARAIGVPVERLQRWTERGHMPNIQEEVGSWRKYSLQDAAYIAAFNAVAVHEGAVAAKKIMEDVLQKRSDRWLTAINESKGVHCNHILIAVWRVSESPQHCAVRELDTVEWTQSTLRGSPIRDSSQGLEVVWARNEQKRSGIGGFLEAAQNPMVTGGEDGESTLRVHPNHVAVFDVGPAVWAALHNLKLP